ncbi:MAG: SGNH/GDSL hydrolase family protein, partial [Pseudomonadota bacterium]
MAALTASSFLVQPGSAYADDKQVGRVFILGDSLSDGGAYSDFVVKQLGLPALSNYRFTNNRIGNGSLTYAEAFAAANGVPTTPFVINDGPGDGENAYANQQGGTNFAQGGSRVADPRGSGNEDGDDPFITTVPVTTQIQQAIERAGGRFRENDVVTITAGANDLFAVA